MSDSWRHGLLPHTKESYGSFFESALLEQYKLYVQSAEDVSSRRIASIRYLLTISTALVALYGFQSAAFGQGLWLLPIPVIGIVSALAWHQIIKSHKDLNKLKFDLIHELEQHLPAAPFQEEWRRVLLGSGHVCKPVTDLERLLPWGFAAIHALLVVMIGLAALDIFDWTTLGTVDTDEVAESAGDLSQTVADDGR